MGPGIRSNYLKFLFGATVCVFVWISNFRSLHQWYMRCCVVFSVHFSFFSGVILHDTLFSCSSLFVVTLLLLLLLFSVSHLHSHSVSHILPCARFTRVRWPSPNICILLNRMHHGVYWFYVWQTHENGMTALAFCTINNYYRCWPKTITVHHYQSFSKAFCSKKKINQVIRTWMSSSWQQAGSRSRISSRRNSISSVPYKSETDGM